MQPLSECHSVTGCTLAALGQTSDGLMQCRAWPASQSSRDKDCSIQVWANCRLYNQDESEIVQLANDLAARFLAAWQQQGLPVVQLPATAPQLRPLANPPIQPRMVARITPSNGVQRLSRHRQGKPAAEVKPAANGQRDQLTSLLGPANGHTQLSGPGAMRRDTRSRQQGPAVASTENGMDHRHLGADQEREVVNAPVSDTVSPSSATVSTDGLQSVQRKPSLKITLRPAGVVKHSVPAAQAPEPSLKKLTVKLRASSADNCK